jgi:hypothetical protein
MKLKWILWFFLFIICFSWINGLEFEEDNEFAEFEVADEKKMETTEEVVPDETPKVKVPDEEAFAEFETTEKKAPSDTKDDFSDIAEEEEYDTFDSKAEEGTDEKKTLEIKPLTFADIPTHFRSNWSSYQVEAIALFIIFLYTVNYFIGKQRNQSLAYRWFDENIELLRDQFALVGDDGISENPDGTLIKETDSSYLVWCSGRVGVSGMLSQMKLVKRQDVIGMVYNWFRPKTDRVIHKIDLDKNEIDPVVFVMGNKKSVAKAVKDYTDLSTYAIERKGLERFGLPASFALHAEIAETISAILDPFVVQHLQKYEKYIDLIHITDQFCGVKLQEGETYTRLPDTSENMFFTFNVIDSADSFDVNRALLNLTFYLLDKLRRYRLSREGKGKAEKKRQSFADSFLKVTHQQRQEAMQARREEQARERKQRLIEEEDPEKQRRLQKLEDKREQRAKAPKMKQLRLK